MNNDAKKVVDVMVEGADKVYDVATDRAVERMEQVAEDIEKDKEVAKKATESAAETAEVLIDAVTDQICELLNGNKLSFNDVKARAIETIDKMVEKADGYYDVITDRLIEKIEKKEQNLDLDIETGKKLVNELKENAKSLKK